MATVPPATGKRKRKRMSKPLATPTSAASSTIDAQLQTLENWHRALTIDLRELRREGSRVRADVTKVHDTVHAAVEETARCAAQTQQAVTTSSQTKDETQQQLRAADTRWNAALGHLSARVTAIETELRRLTGTSITEEFLLTQLTELQEHYEDELAQVREGRDAAVATQQQQLTKMETVMVKVQDETTHEFRLLAKMVQSLKDQIDGGIMLQRAMPEEVVSWQAMQQLQQQVEKMESEKRKEAHRTKAELQALTNRVVEMEKQSVAAHGASARLAVDETEKQAGMVAVGWAAPDSGNPSHGSQSVVRQEDLVGIQNELRRIDQDFHAVGVDIASLAKQISARESHQKQFAETRLQELSSQLFDALSHDSRLHAAEITRLKDAVFDVQSRHHEFDQGMRRLQDAVEHAIAARQDRDKDLDWHYYGRTPPPVPLTSQPSRPPSVTSRDYRDRPPSRYDPPQESPPHDRITWAPSRHDPPPGSPPHDRITWAPSRHDLPRESPPHNRIAWAPKRRHRSRSRSPRRRSRSRSPHNRSSWGEPGYRSCDSDHGSATFGQNAHRDDRFRYSSPRSNPQSDEEVDVAMNADSSLANSPQATYRETRRDAIEQSQENQTTRLFRRKGRSRRTQEVIVIEDDDDDDHHGVHVADERESTTSRRGAPLDVVLDEEEEALQPTDIFMTTPAVDVAVAATPSSTSNDRVEATDLLQQEEDLQMGFLLYFCLGGAPDLNVQWTTSFTQLKSDECAGLPQVLRFQRRYVFLQSFPVCLTQCILQAVILNRQNVPEQTSSKASQITCAFNACSIRAKYDDMIRQKHLSWAKCVIKHLMERARGTSELAIEELELSVNPAAVSDAVDKDDVITEWSRRQELAMYALARKLRCRSFLPAMKGNVDTSPSVYLFALMFDVLTATSECPQSGTFRLNGFGSKLMAHLWDHTLKKLPYVLFADWSWLDDQSTKMKMPVLAFCHVLASILLWNSAIDGHSLTNPNIYAAAVTHLLSKVCMRGQPVDRSVVDSGLLQLAEWESTHIELHNLDSKFASMLGLDGFFEVTEAIDNNNK
ncbi:unnamed protein product [Hyaloperonospora brassicae]|uniref:Uncharacterized protein n=1 Tax=Hyaloperonospora brassicae TaxID=162125 RepID=A0AAV0U3E1_HYABA|nr:unnamed protein product [Hyaloperonospora brassicae]